MSGGPQLSLVSEIDRLQASIDRAAAATEVALAGCPPASEVDGPCSPPAERAEGRRPLAALRERSHEDFMPRAATWAGRVSPRGDARTRVRYPERVR
jgi:hypothetical protein